MKTKNKILTIFICVTMAFASFVPSAYALEAPELTAEAVVLADLDSGNILYEKNMNKDHAPASLTKIMTGLLAVEAIENGVISENDIITAAEDCQSGLDIESSTANPAIQPGEQMQYIDVVYCALLHSANEACNVIAETLSGNLSSFVDEMNLKARSLGAENTRFFDTNGLLSENTTTPYDLYLITKEAMSHPLFATIVNTESYTVPATNMTAEARTLHNSNALLTKNSDYGGGYKYDGVSGVKTGYTSAAGYCLVSTCKRNGMSLLCIVMGCSGWLNTRDDTYGNFADSIKLYDWAFENFEHRVLVSQGDNFGSVKVEHALDDANTTLIAKDTMRVVMPSEYASSDITKKVALYNNEVTAPVSYGDELGEVGIYVQGNYFGSVKLVAGNDVNVEKSHVVGMKILQLLNNKPVKITGIIILALLVIGIVIRRSYAKAKKRHMISRAKAEDRRNAQRAEQEKSRRQAVDWKTQIETEERDRKINTIDPIERRPVETDLDELIKSLGLGEDKSKEKGKKE